MSQQNPPPDDDVIPLDDADDTPIALTPKPAKAPAPAPAAAPDEDEPISLVETASTGQVRQATRLGEQIRGQLDFSRSLNAPGTGAIRCRIFHSKISDTSLKSLEDQINEWLDANPDVEVKHVGHNIGSMQGKVTEDNLVVTVWF